LGGLKRWLSKIETHRHWPTARTSQPFSSALTLEGVLYGGIAALILGVNSILIAVAARWWGVWRVTAATLTMAYLILLVYAWVLGDAVPLDAGGLLPLMALLGLAAASSYFASHQSLKLGPVSVVSPVGSLTGAVTVLFAFMFLGERPDLVQWVGIPVATAGVMLLSLEFKEGGEARLIGWGPVFALFGVVTGAVSNAGLRIPVRDIGPLAAILTQRTFSVVWVLTAMAALVGSGKLKDQPPHPDQLPARLFRVRPGEPGFRARAWPLMSVVALLDAAAFVAFAEGLAVAPAWLIGLLSQSGRVISVAGGLIIFKETLVRTQWIGLALTAAGLVLVVVG
jgi:drug/metabolite transporter (DMT)-like permease